MSWRVSVHFALFLYVLAVCLSVLALSPDACLAAYSLAYVTACPYTCRLFGFAYLFADRSTCLPVSLYVCLLVFLSVSLYVCHCWHLQHCKHNGEHVDLKLFARAQAHERATAATAM